MLYFLSVFSKTGFNKIGRVDRTFFLICVIAIVVAIGIYMLIPVFNKKQYEEQRKNLREREEAFKANKKTSKDKESNE